MILFEKSLGNCTEGILGKISDSFACLAVSFLKNRWMNFWRNTSKIFKRIPGGDSKDFSGGFFKSINDYISEEFYQMFSWKTLEESA